MASYEDQQIVEVAAKLKARLERAEDKRSVLRAPELSALYDHLKTLPAGSDRAAFGKEVNALREELERLVRETVQPKKDLKPIDVTAPFDVNAKLPQLLSVESGSRHPITKEIENIVEIFSRMGFEAVESRELDDDYHMFSSLNFPEDHPARDDYDTFMTEESLVAPAHTSTMQNRVLKARKKDLEAGKGIRVVIPDRVFRNDDLDARHEHTFYQLEGVYVDKGVSVANLIATLQTFLETYYSRQLKVKTQPFYFPFTEPSFEFAISCPFCDEKGCHICSQAGWIELLGCGMIHPNVLREAGIDPNTYTGFAWGCGIDRLVMMKYSVEDVRYFHSGNLKFLRQFK